MLRTFRARVRIYSLEKQPQAEADCLLSVELERFAATRWSGTLSGIRPAAPPAGRYLMRFPNGRVREVDLGADDFTGCPFTGIGSLPMP
jgi:hypothetical protein